MKADKNKELSAALEEWIQEDLEPSPQLEANIRASFRNAHPPRARKLQVPAWAAAVLLLIGLGLGNWFGPARDAVQPAEVVEKIVYVNDTIYLDRQVEQAPVLAEQAPAKASEPLIERKRINQAKTTTPKPAAATSTKTILASQSQNAAESKDILALTGRVW